MKFKPCGNYALDEASGIMISLSRILPEERDDGKAGIEYQYIFRLNDEIIEGFGISGSMEITKENGDRIESYKLEISHESTIKRMLQFKNRIGNTDNDYGFISEIANGMAAVFTETESNTFAQHHLVITTHEALQRQNIEIPTNTKTTISGEIVLAESHTPPHPVPNLTP